MARFFDGTDDKVTTSLGGASGVGTGALTIAGICRCTGDGASRRLIALGSSTSSTPRHGLGRTAANVLDFRRGNASLASVLTVTAADGWVLIAANIAAGTTTCKFHKYVFSTNTWTHETSVGTMANGTAPATANYIGATNGGASGFWIGDIEIAAAWGANFTDAQIESLPFSLPSWFQVQPAVLWVLDQAATTQSVGDLTGGGANQSALVGTTVGSSSVPLFNRFDDAIVVTRQAAAAPAATVRLLGTTGVGT